MLRFTWLPLGLGAAFVAWPGCGAADNDGVLDVLSELSDGGVPAELSDGAASADASDGAAPVEDGGASPHEANISPNCATDTVACRTCRTVTMCLAPWLDCTADGTCIRADRTATSCICNAQMTDPGAIASCEAAFRATGTQAVALDDCVVSRCASECGL
jgi:hypothetical protein